MQQTKEGVVKAVSKYAGIIFENDGKDNWYNAEREGAEDLKSDVRNNIKKGMRVSLELIDEKTYSSWKSLTGAVAESRADAAKDKYWARREERDMFINERTKWAGLLNTATELIKMSGQKFTDVHAQRAAVISEAEALNNFLGDKLNAFAQARAQAEALGETEE